MTDRVYASPPLDDDDVTWIDGVDLPGADGGIVTSLLSIISWVSAEGSPCWRIITRHSGSTAELIGTLTLALHQLESIAMLGHESPYWATFYGDDDD